MPVREVDPMSGNDVYCRLTGKLDMFHLSLARVECTTRGKDVCTEVIQRFVHLDLQILMKIDPCTQHNPFGAWVLRPNSGNSLSHTFETTHSRSLGLPEAVFP